MSEMKLLSNIGDKKIPNKFKLDYLESYYSFRSYDSYHSIRGGTYCCSLYPFNEYNPDTGNYKGFNEEEIETGNLPVAFRSPKRISAKASPPS